MEYNTELYHHGVKGMKWGIRRFQNKDGSLTPAGKKRQAKLEAELNQLGGKKSAASKTEEAPRKKTVSEMTDDELRTHTTRMQLEKNYYEAQKNLAVANPPRVSKGKKFIDSMVNEVIAPAAKTAGKEWLTKFMKDSLGLKEEKKLSWDDKIKKQTWEKNQREYEQNKELEKIQKEIALIKAQKSLEKERDGS